MAPAAFPASMAAEKLGKGRLEHGPANRRSAKGGRIQCGRRKEALRRMVEGAVAPRRMVGGAEKPRAGWPKERKSPGKGQGRDGT